MNERRINRYRIWELAKNGNARGKPELARQLDDLAALMALYDYRLLVDVELRGTCTLPDGASTACKTKTISPKAVDLLYDVQTADPSANRGDAIPEGSAAHVDLERIGAFRGVVTSKDSEGFRVAVDEDCRPMLRNKLARVAAERGISLDDGSALAGSSITRIEPLIKACSFTDHLGTLRKGKIVNVSRIDALIRTPVIPPLASRIVFRGSRRDVAEVTHAFEVGFAVRFLIPIPAEEFSIAIKFSDE
jgi:hypothetical protein